MREALHLMGAHYSFGVKGNPPPQKALEQPCHPSSPYLSHLGKVSPSAALQDQDCLGMTPVRPAAAPSSPHTLSDSARSVGHITSPICWQLTALPAAPQNHSSSAERQDGIGDPPPWEWTETPKRAWGHPDKCHYRDSSGTAPL